MPDNDASHAALFVENFLEAKIVQNIETLVCSPDLNPIKHVWDTVGNSVAAKPRPPVTIKAWSSHFYKDGRVFPKVL